LVVVDIDLRAAAGVIGLALKAMDKAMKFPLERKNSGAPIAQHQV